MAKKNKEVRDPWALDSETVDSKKKQAEQGSRSTVNWLDFKEFISRDKKTVRVKVRIAPRKGKGKFWKDYGHHYKLTDPETGRNTARPCPKAFAGAKCPICEKAIACFKTNSEEGKALGKKHSVIPKNAVQCFVDGDYETPYVYGFTDYQFRDVLEMVQDPDLGNMSHPKDGYDLIATVKQVKGKDYPDVSWAAGKPSKIPREALDELDDLDDMLTCDCDKKALQALAKMIPSDIKEFLGEGEEDNEEESPVKKSKKKPSKPVKSSKKKPAVEDDEDDEDEDYDDDDDDDFNLPF